MKCIMVSGLTVFFLFFARPQKENFLSFTERKIVNLTNFQIVSSEDETLLLVEVGDSIHAK